MTNERLLAEVAAQWHEDGAHALPAKGPLSHQPQDFA